MEYDKNQIWRFVDSIAEQSNCKKRHVGCIIVDDHGTLISSGFNEHLDGVCDCETTKTAVHAEINAINNIPVYHRGEDLYAYVNHEPCDKCASLLKVVCQGGSIQVNPTSVRFNDIEIEDEPFSDDVLQTRGGTHGVFEESAEFVQQVKDTMRQCTNWYELSEDKREALDMIQHKVGRVLHGDANFKDHWTDISGYARLIEKEL